MDDYAASQIQVENLIKAVQSIKDTLKCVICFDFFEDPVTIKCGHKFCRKCIERVASLANSTCPCCKTKIKKRSIQKESNKLLQECVRQFHLLSKAIKDDSGIDVLQPINRTTPTEETAVIHDKPSSSKHNPLSQTSSSKKLDISQKSSLSTNKKSEKSKIFHGKSKTSKSEELLSTPKNLLLSKKSPGESKFLGSKLSLKKKKTDNCSPEISSSLPNQNVSSYLSNKEDQIEPEEKVKSWLENNLTPEVDNDPDINSELKNTVTSEKPYVTERRPKESPTIEDSSTSETNICEEKSKEMNSSKEKRKADTSLKDSKFKEIQKNVQYADMIAKRRKLNQFVPEKSTLKTTPTVAATSHDWKRIKKVGREMQAKTFKSLNVSIEKSTPSIVLDDTVQCHSTSNEESKNVSREIDSSGDAFVTKRRKFKKPNSSDNSKNLGSSDPAETEKNTIDLSDSPEKENKSLTCRDVRKHTKVSAIHSDQMSPEKVEDTSNILQDFTVKKSKKQEPLKTRLEKGLCENENSDDSFESIGGVSGFKNSLARRKLSLKKTLKSSENSKQNLSSPSTEKLEEIEIINKSPVKPKSKLSLRLQINASSEKPVVITNTPVNKNPRNKSSKISKSSFVIFKKLSKFSKKRKVIPFLYLGKVKLKNTTENSDKSCGIISVTKVDKGVQVDLTPNLITSDIDSSKTINKTGDVKILSPEKDSQLKFLTIETPAHHQQSMDVSNDINKSKTVNCNQKHSNPMETEEIASTSIVVNQHQLDFREAINKSVKDETMKSNAESNKDVMEPTKNVDENNAEDQTETNYTTDDVEMRVDVEPVLDIHPQEIEDFEEIIPESNNFMINQNRKKIVEPHNVDKSKLFKIIEKDHVSESSSISKASSNKRKIDEVQEIISISSHDSELRNFDTNSQKSEKSACTVVSSKSNNNNSGSESNVDSDFSVTKRRYHKKPQKQKSSSLCSSNASSRKKKRSLSNDESSNDEDLPSILGKWTGSGATVVPKSKKQKLSLDDDSDTVKNNRQSSSETYKADDRHSTRMVTEAEFEQPEKVESDKNPQNSDAHKAKNSKEKEAPAKIINMPSSLLSTDLFESHQPLAQASPKQLNKIISDHFSRDASPIRNKNKDKDDVGSPHSSNFSMSDLIRFNRMSNLSESSESSNKENNRDENNLLKENCPLEKINEIDDLISEIGCSQVDKEAPQKHMPLLIPSDDQFSDSMMNITQEQVNLKNIEKALIGDLSVVDKDKNETIRKSDFKAVEEQAKDSPDDSDIDSDNIRATPVTKKRSTYNFVTPRTAELEIPGFSQEVNTPDHNLSLIPAITPVKNRKSYPLSHSTPMMHTPTLNSKLEKYAKPITLICSGLHPDHINNLKKFANKFSATFLNNWSPEVTHVIIKTDPVTKTGQKTFKYIQGIAFKKFVVSYDWIVDCLKENRVLDEENVKYEVLDPDILESGSKKSMAGGQNLYEEFAFYCLEPFTSFSLNDFKSILRYNGAEVCDSLNSFASIKDKYKVILLESEELTQNQISELKKTKGVLLSYEWIVDSISQFNLITLFPCLYETTVEEAISFGFPAEYLHEETLDEEVEEEEQESD